MALNDWMKDYQDVELGRLHMPGSHDAGTNLHDLDLTTFGTNSNSATQNLTIVEQLMVGTRFFDLRLKTHHRKVVAHHTTGGQGATSKTAIDDVVADAAQFCRANPTEVVIFRFSHTSASTNVQDIVRASGRGALHTGAGNLCTKKLHTIVAQGGGLICIFDEEKFGGAINQAQGIHGFAKYKSTPANPQGLSTCGCYSGTHQLHGVLSDGLRGQYEHNTSHGINKHEHLWQVYWQKTYKNPWSMQGIEGGSGKDLGLGKRKAHGGTHASTDYMLGLMTGLGDPRGTTGYEVQKEKTKGVISKKVTQQRVMYSTQAVRRYSLPNIVSYDFVNATTNEQIIELNNPALQALRAHAA